MMTVDHDPLLTELAGLRVEAPDDLLDRVAARWVRVPGPTGNLLVASTDHGVAYVRLDRDGADEADEADEAEFADSFRRRFGRPLLPGNHPPTGLLSALRAGRPGDLRFDLRECSEFQRAVLLATASIPRGQVRPYGWIAREIGHPGAVRAVGTALGRNPVPVLIPCHRVVRGDGAPSGYVFGPGVRHRLLRAEGADLDAIGQLARRGVRYLASDTTGIVCFPSCSNARRITPAHRHGFGTLAEAQHAGYRPCAVCSPAGGAAPPQALGGVPT
jgi:methylated-DNA-[protein]-cysteine S-methyltransferase